MKSARETKEMRPEKGTMEACGEGKVTCLRGLDSKLSAFGLRLSEATKLEAHETKQKKKLFNFALISPRQSSLRAF
jgi:hypothetical protein